MPLILNNLDSNSHMFEGQRSATGCCTLVTPGLGDHGYQLLSATKPGSVPKPNNSFKATVSVFRRPDPPTATNTHRAQWDLLWLSIMK